MNDAFRRLCNKNLDSYIVLNDLLDGDDFVNDGEQ